MLQQFRGGIDYGRRRYDRVISYWSNAKDVIQDKLMDSLENTNPIYMMSDSVLVIIIQLYAARGNASIDGRPGRPDYRVCRQVVIP